MVRIPKKIEQMSVTIEKRHKPAYIQAIEDDEVIQEEEEEEEEPWYMDILNYVTKGEYPPHADKRAKRALRLLTCQYVLIDNELHKRVSKGQALLCVGKKDAQRAMRIVHEGICGTLVNGNMLVQKIM